MAPELNGKNAGEFTLASVSQEKDREISRLKAIVALSEHTMGFSPDEVYSSFKEKNTVLNEHKENLFKISDLLRNLYSLASEPDQEKLKKVLDRSQASIKNIEDTMFHLEDVTQMVHSVYLAPNTQDRLKVVTDWDNGQKGKSTFQSNAISVKQETHSQVKNPL